MPRRFLTCVIMLCLLMSVHFAGAQDTEPPPGTPEENECYPGGVLYREENQDGCPTEWHWKAGWFLAQVNQGRLARADMPEEFASVLPPLPPEEGDNEPEVVTVCGYAIIIQMLFTGCMSSNGTGTLTAGNTLVGYFLFVNVPEECPDTFNGYTYSSYNSRTQWMSLYGFTEEDAASIGGLPEVLCEYPIR